MAGYSELQQAEFAAEAEGYTATRHQREVGVGYFDAVAMAISGGTSSTTALAGSTEAAQFHDAEPDSAEPAPLAPRGAGTRQPALTVSADNGYDDGIVHGHDWARGASLNV